MAFPPSREEPPNRREEATKRWYSRVGFSLVVSYGGPVYLYSQLGGVHWDCPACERTASVVLRRRRRNYLWFFCTGCRRRLYRFVPDDGYDVVAGI